MALSGWVIASAVFVIILMLTIGIGWWIRNNRVPSPVPPNIYSAPLVWGTPTAGPNPKKNVCQLYEFPTSLVPTTSIAIPGAPTYNSLILDNLNGELTYPDCLDSDQLLARQVKHTCTAPNGVISGAITRCTLLEGGTTGLGGSEIYYTNTGCFKVGPCAGQLSLVSVNYQGPNITPNHCIDTGGRGGIEPLNPHVTVQVCDPSKKTQLLRITRIDIGQNPNSLQPGQGQNGLIAQILDRETGLCLLPDTAYDNSYYDPSSVGCTGNVERYLGLGLRMGTCTGGEFPGYVWALLPSMSYCGITGGCSSCTGCPGCHRITNTNNCTGCAGCTGTEAMATPQQIAYVGNLDLTKIPKTTYNGLSGSSAVYQWLAENNALSIFYGGTGPTAVLLPLNADITSCTVKPFTSQYINIPLYNTITSQQVCIQNGTPNCSGF